eukprot:gene25524-33318_t
MDNIFFSLSAADNASSPILKPTSFKGNQSSHGTATPSASPTYTPSAIPTPTYVYSSSCLVFDGNSYISVASYDQVFPWADFTIEAWIQTPNVNTNSIPVVSLGRDQSNAKYFTFGYLFSKLTFGNVDDSGNLNYIFGRSILSAGVPYFAVFVKQGTTGTFYLNGQRDGDPKAVDSVTYNPSPLTIGGDSTIAQQFYFQGFINQIKIHSTARTASEVSALYSMGPATSCPFPTATPTGTPTTTPTTKPTTTPTTKPTTTPTARPTVKSATKVSKNPTLKSSVAPAILRTNSPTVVSTLLPKVQPTSIPSLNLSGKVTATPAITLTTETTAEPTLLPTVKPTAAPTLLPSSIPTATLTVTPTAIPTNNPTVQHSSTVVPTLLPSVKPTAIPTSATAIPTITPIAKPTAAPTLLPTVKPSATPK